MRTQYALSEDDIREAIAAYVARKFGGTITAENVKLHVTKLYDYRDVHCGERVSASVKVG